MIRFTMGRKLREVKGLELEPLENIFFRVLD